MSINSLSKKLLIKPGKSVLLVNSPQYYISLLEPLPEAVQISFDTAGNYDVIQLFVLNNSELKKELKNLQSYFLADTIIWIAYPKKTSGTATDLGMMSSWEETSRYNLRPVASVAINETWTALRFRPNDQIKNSDVSNSSIRVNELSKYIDVDKRIITLPPELRKKLNPQAADFFKSLSYTNKKEYITWILTAKQEKTRTERILKSAEKLSAGKKNPSEK
ncbi:MAG: hypothetical protein B7X86_01890 [Sphingobacteriales bacterium 17-39-43]|uniref:YdeI/OmpD-associated family protein n=1 Tax=Daejeonella sp. TaxID=2805397 RepID=UPI000BD295E8|nr:YdeI/OmpD-associated family protein [Daejeonella sp.]MCF8453684.1 YdeI/OmpD-associated family protein [Pedobacter sp.]OYZ33102.1 MAG: hypothetical protein B7Y24_01895 [Sphingobacteriales bacterium 16-39-50]OYZ54100.1 MAG: hypothetical protein B7Y19_05215 [Sphingobacteriales bacterium 24-40-4]OZA26511.1 MAG: hypothetical protein B7X86_01890 [Sphingobacteriales bacterium 17-39-43]HQT21662.1 YdeI/OmpD-associated family protein [Daejeonella sp.]